MNLDEFRWFHCLDLAQILVDLDDNPNISEARLRTSINRSYFAVFCQARNYLRDVERDPYLCELEMNPNSPRGGSVHSYVKKKFKGSRDPIRGIIDTFLGNLLEYRKQVDYDDFVEDLRNKSKAALRLARKTHNLLNSL